MTSLQNQLAAIAASSSHQLDLKAQRTAHSQSLLYDAKVASSQDFDTIFQICLEGFHELCGLDKKFVAFAGNLFSEQSKDQDRTLMTADQQQQLDTNVERFLCLLSGRLLLKPAQKAVEWLIRRFRIHEYNTVFTILTFLMYHETPIFTTLLSILPKPIPHSFRFLGPYIASLQHPPRAAITSAASTTPPLFTALNSFVLKVVKHHAQTPNLISFWAVVATQAVHGMITAGRSGRPNVQKQKEEDLLMGVVPVLNKGLALRHSPDMVMACYMIIIVLVMNLSLDDKILDALFEAVVRSRDADTEELCMQCLAMIAHERRHARLASTGFALFAQIPRLDDKLSQVQKECRADRLSLAYVLGVIENHDNIVQARQAIVERIIMSGKLTVKQTRLIVKSLVRELIATPPDSVPPSRITQLIQTICNDTRFTSAVTEALSESKVEMSHLENLIGQVLLPHFDGAQAESNADTVMQDVISDKSVTGDGASIAALADTKLSSPSLLDPVNSDALEKLRLAFSHAVSVQEQYRILEISVLAKCEALRQTSCVSFLVACGTSATLPGSTRSAAWNSITSILGESDTRSDMQNVVPFALYALGDSHKLVRRAAAETLIKLSDVSKATQKVKGSFVWGKDLYGANSFSIEEMLSAEDLSKFLDSFLIPRLEESVLDQDNIMKSLSTALAGQSTGESSKKDMKANLRDAVATFLAVHAARTPALNIRIRLLRFMSNLGKKATHIRNKYLVPLVKQWFSLSTDEVGRQLSPGQVKEQSVNEVHLNVLSLVELESMQVFQDLLSERISGSGRESWLAATTFLGQRWKRVKPSVRRALAVYVLDLFISGQNGSAQSFLRAVELDADALATFLQKIPSSRMPHEPPTSRRRRTSRSESKQKDVRPDDVASHLRLMTLILELVDNSTLKPEHTGLIEGLFHALEELQHLRAQTSSSMVYLQSLVISALLDIVKSVSGLKQGTFDASVVRTDLLVDCIRHSTSPQLQNTALLLISHLATWLPDTVLHSVMPIFTFMGSTLLRQGDEYSAHVIDQTVSRVVPPLATSLRKAQQNFVLGICDLLMSFTAAYEHIPTHRRLKLFVQLVRTLSPEDSLAATVILLLDRHPLDQSVRRFVSELLRSFDSITWVAAIKSTLGMIEDGMRARTERRLTNTLLGFSDKTPGDIEIALDHLIVNITEIMQDRRLRIAISKSLRDNATEHSRSNLRTAISSLIESTVHLSSTAKARGTLSLRAKAAIMGSLHLPPPIDLMQVAREMMGKSDEELRRIALQAVRLQAPVQEIKAAVSERQDFVRLVFAEITKSSSIELRKTAISCLSQLCLAFGKRELDLLNEACQIVAGPTALGASEAELRAVSLNCIASLAEITREDFVPLVPSVLRQTFSYLDHGLIDSTIDPDFHEAAYALFNTLIEHLPFIFSAQYLEKCLELTHLSANASSGQKPVESRRQFYLLFSTQINAGARFKALDATWSHAVMHGPTALQEHAEGLHFSVRSASKAEIIRHATMCTRALLQGFDLRRLAEENAIEKRYEPVDIVTHETKITDISMGMIMKLNDATFRPVFTSMVEWAFASPSKGYLLGQEARALTFFTFLTTFFNRLKSLVTSYASHVLQPASAILSREEPPAKPLLLATILGALEACFEHDTNDFWSSPSQFATVSAPMTGLLTYKASKNAQAEELVRNHVIPSITVLAKVASSSDLHRELNNQIMGFLRADDAHTRLSAVKCEYALTDSLGEDWLNLLPEMLPIIAELQEDDDDEVENETLRWIKRIEEILGESLDGMLQ